MRVTFAWFIIVLALGSGCGVQSTPTYTVNDPADANTTWRTERPLTFEEAKAIGKCPIPLPPEATNIQYVDFYAGYGGFSRHVRFEAPVAVCRDHANKVITEHNSWQTQVTQKLEFDPKPLDRVLAASLAASARKGETVSQARWFDTDRIQDGIMWGDNRSHTPVVAIDRDKGIFYYCISD